MIRNKEKFRRRRVAGILWFAGFVAALYAYWLVMADFVVRNFWDPPYEMKLERLEAQQAKYPGHPLWLLMGSSRVMVGVRPDVLAGRLGEKDAPLVFNFGMGGVGLARQFIYFKRLLHDGIKPRRVGIEVFEADIAHEIFAASDGPFLATRARENEIGDYLRYSTTPPDFAEIRSRSRWDPIFRYGMIMPNQTLSWRILPLPGIRRLEKVPYDKWGWVMIESTTQEDEYGKIFAINKARYEGDFAHFAVAPKSDLVLRDYLALCRDQGIEAFFLKMPEADDFRAMHTAEGDAALAAYLAKLQEEFGDPLVDASTWIERSGFSDGHHLNGVGAAQFTNRLGAELYALKWAPPKARQ